MVLTTRSVFMIDEKKFNKIILEKKYHAIYGVKHVEPFYTDTVYAIVTTYDNQCDEEFMKEMKEHSVGIDSIEKWTGDNDNEKD